MNIFWGILIAIIISLLYMPIEREKQAKQAQAEKEREERQQEHIRYMKAKAQQEQMQRQIEQEQIEKEKKKKYYLNMTEIERVDNLQPDIIIALAYLHDEASAHDLIAKVKGRQRNFPQECSNYIADAIECLAKVGILEVKGDKANPYYSFNKEFYSFAEDGDYPPYSELVKQANVQKSFSGISAVDKMEGHQFEHYCAGLLRKLNFSDVEVTKGSGDQGVDIIAVKEGIRYAIQCKCYSSSLGNSPVQEVNAGKQMYHCHVAVVLTNQYFTSGAKELAGATGVLLWDRDELAKMIQKAQEANK